MTTLGEAATSSPGGTPCVTARSGPVVVLTYAHAGARRLRSLLGDSGQLACTVGTGLLPLCDQAAAVWKQAEGRRSDSLSPLAASSVRRLANSVITIIVARIGRRRWCETAVAQQSGAETFLQLYPDAQFLCLHRACPDVVYAALRANPWGLAGQAFTPFTAAHPASDVAAAAAYWAAHAGPLLGFEESHPGACLRVRYEDLVTRNEQTARDIEAFLGLDTGATMPPLPAGDGPARALDGADAPGCGDDMPVGQLPPPLVTQVNDLHARLAYPPLRPSSASP